MIEVEDDGRGIDEAALVEKAVESGKIAASEATQLVRDEILALIFVPGLSTREQADDLSGRGVGMDIVKAKVSRLGGRLRLTSTPGAGTTVTIRVPMTLAITRILLVRAGGQLFGLPLGAVIHIVRPDANAVSTIGGERVIEASGRTYPLRDLAALLELPRTPENAGIKPVLVANLGGRHVALAVDEIVQSRDAVIKTLGSHLRRVPGMWGATLLGDGTVILILNPADLAGSADETRVRTPVPRPAASETRPYTILVVDDSLSMRHVLSSAVKKAGWNPLQARDGVEALEMVTRAAELPDLILLDIEMPRMDGYEFLATARAQAALRTLPIVMLTSRGGDKHRERAMSLGATGYLVKPFQEEALLQYVDRLVRESRGRLEAAS
jgi:chemosensory pili system protein ChpA (sensor histidine kinase/response regulator)